MFELAFTDNLTFRSLNVVEHAAVVSALSRMLSRENGDEMDNYLTLMELPGGEHSIEMYMGINALEDHIKSYLLRWNISAPHAARLNLFTKEDRWQLFTVVELLQLHGGKLKQFVDLVFEISKRDKKSIREIFGASPERDNAIIKNTKITATQKQAKILDWLYAKRYPQLTKRAQTFSAIAASMNSLQPGVFTPPHNFEGDKLRASLPFKSLDEIDSFCTALKKVSNRKKIKSLLDLL